MIGATRFERKSYELRPGGELIVHRDWRVLGILVAAVPFGFALWFATDEAFADPPFRWGPFLAASLPILIGGLCLVTLRAESTIDASEVRHALVWVLGAKVHRAPRSSLQRVRYSRSYDEDGLEYGRTELEFSYLPPGFPLSVRIGPVVTGVSVDAGRVDAERIAKHLGVPLVETP